MASYLLENPFRRGKRRRRRARRSSSRRRRARRSNPVYLAGNPSRRRRRGRRRSSSRRRGRRRSNPFSLGGGGILKPIVQAGAGVASVFAGEFLTAMLRKQVTQLQQFNTGVAQAIVAVAGGFVLRKFGGPLRQFAGTFTAANLLFALWRQPFIPSGMTVAVNSGLGDVDPEYGMIGNVGDYAIGGMSDWYTGSSYGVPAYAQ